MDEMEELSFFSVSAFSLIQDECLTLDTSLPGVVVITGEVTPKACSVPNNI